MKDFKLMVMSAVCLMFLQVAGYAEIVLPPVLSSHMVLQRGVKVPIWGTAAPGEKVTVKFRDQEKSATADAQGKWKVSLDSLKEGGPDVLTVAGSNTLKLEDVLVGEVWLGSGQSNMFGGPGEYVKGDEVLAKMVAAGPYPKLRLIRLDSPASKGWKEATRSCRFRTRFRVVAKDGTITYGSGVIRTPLCPPAVISVPECIRSTNQGMGPGRHG